MGSWGRLPRALPTSVVPATTPKPFASSFSTMRLPVRPVEPATKTVAVFFSASGELDEAASMVVDAALQRKRSFFPAAGRARAGGRGRWGRAVTTQAALAMSFLCGVAA